MKAQVLAAGGEPRAIESFREEEWLAAKAAMGDVPRHPSPMTQLSTHVVLRLS